MQIPAVAPSDPAVAPPPRRPGSVRRTSTMLMMWPEGLGTKLHLKGRCRDLLTPAEGEPEVVDQADLVALSAMSRVIEHLESNPSVEGVERLIGCKGGNNLRSSIGEELPGEVEAGTPLHLLLDDLAGSTLIAGFVYVRWRDHIPGFAEFRERAPSRYMRDICSGFRDGASSLFADGTISHLLQNVAPVGPIADPVDPWSWHELDDHPPVAMRRARRIDVWREDGSLGIDAMFRDSCWDPDGSEVAVHEYQILASADANTGTITSISAQPRVLPYVECPLAAPNASWLVGMEMRSMRREVLERLRGTDCCTHLNDALRSLAEVPLLAQLLLAT
jgi:hypothetical protein